MNKNKTELIESALRNFCEAFTNRGETTSLKEWTDRMRKAHADALEALVGREPYAEPLPQTQSPVLGEKKPRLFYWEEAEDAWCPAKGLKVEDILTTDLFMRDGDIIKVHFRRTDMTDAEFKSIPEG